MRLQKYFWILMKNTWRNNMDNFKPKTRQIQKSKRVKDHAKVRDHGRKAKKTKGTCEHCRKINYGSKSKARSHIKYMRSCGSADKLEVYECPIGNGIHIMKTLEKE